MTDDEILAKGLMTEEQLRKYRTVEVLMALDGRSRFTSTDPLRYLEGVEGNDEFGDDTQQFLRELCEELHRRWHPEQYSQDKP